MSDKSMEEFNRAMKKYQDYTKNFCSNVQSLVEFHQYNFNTYEIESSTVSQLAQTELRHFES